MTASPNKLALVAELRRRGLTDLATRAEKGEFSDFASPHAMPVRKLVEELGKANQPDLRQRVMQGEFDHDE